MPQDLLLEMVDQTAMARANNTHDPTIQRIAEIKDQLDDGLGGRKNASKRATLTRKLEDLKEELEQNPEKMHGYIRDVFGGHKTDAPAPASPKIDTEAPSQFAQHDEQTQDRLIDELAQDAKTSDDLKNTHPYIKELADLTAGIERLESNREGKSARQLSKMGRNAQNLRAANERLETVKDEIKANPSIMDRALPSQSPLSSHPLDNVAGDKNLIQEAQNMGIDIKTMPAAVATMQTDNTFQAPQI
jgi:DNA repair exonuclease SbcCD ATPase subunit